MKFQNDTQGEYEIVFTKEEMLGDPTKKQLMVVKKGDDLLHGSFSWGKCGYKCVKIEIVKSWDLDVR